MVSYESAINNEDKHDFRKEIMDWCKGKEQILNITAPPYSSSLIFLDAIMYYVNQGKSVLYITGEDEECIEIIENIKRATDFRKYSYLRKSELTLNSNLLVTNYEKAMRLKEEFDLIIYDDIRSFSKYSYCEIMEVIIKNCSNNNKVICYSIESIFKNAREIEIPARSNGMPITEPRIITTRIDITKDMPYVIYEYLSWSMETNRRVVIYVYDKETVFTLYDYLNNFRNELCRNLIPYIKNQGEKKSIINFLKTKKSILITDDFSEPDCIISDIDVIVYCADDERFTAKKLVYFCGKAGRGEKANRGEVIFLGNVLTDPMEKTKSITRHFNKEAWEMNLLKI